MAIDVRCPDCNAKLRLDEPLDPDSPIECPRCGSTFDPPADAPPKPKKPKKEKKEKAAKEKSGGGKKIKSGGKSRKVKKKRTNPVVLLIAIAFGFIGLIAVGSLLVWFANRAGKVEQMLTFVPADCNWARGIKVGELAKYPGYKAEVDKFFTPEVRAVTEDIAKGIGLPPETFVDYCVIAKNRTTSGTGTLFVIQTSKVLPDDISKGLSGASSQNVNGTNCYRLPAKGGSMGSALVAKAGPKTIVIAQAGGMQDTMMRGSLSARANPAESFGGKLDATCKVVMRGSIWLLVKATGGNKDYISSMSATVSGDLKAVSERGSKSPTFGVWTSPGGGGVRIGVALQCSDPKDADALVTAMKEGPLGKGDESEPPNQLKTALGSLTGNKKVFGEMMQYMKYRSSKECAYLTSDLQNDNATQAMAFFNNPQMGTGETGGFGGPMGGGGMPGMGAPPGAGPSQPGLPGGIVTPGMGPGR